jgi:nucleotide-binding universal stress UspA family protein
MSATHTKLAAAAQTPAQNSARIGFKNILFATDFSSAAEQALPYAAGLAISFGATLHTIYVKEPVNYALPVETWQAEEAASDAQLQVLTDRLRREYPAVATKSISGEGIVWSAIEDAVQRFSIDLVVIGTRGRTGVAKFLLGSQAEQILRLVSCPVLTVGPHVTSEQRRQGRMRSMVFATDFGPASVAASRYAVSLAQEYDSTLSLLHVIPAPESDAPQSSNESAALCKKVLEQLCPPDANPWCQPVFVVDYGQAAAKILETAEKQNADLIVLGVHPPKGFPGAAAHLARTTVHQVIAHANCAVLTVPADRRSS